MLVFGSILIVILTAISSCLSAPIVVPDVCASQNKECTVALHSYNLHKGRNYVMRHLLIVFFLFTAMILFVRSFEL